MANKNTIRVTGETGSEARAPDKVRIGNQRRTGMLRLPTLHLAGADHGGLRSLWVSPTYMLEVW